MSKLKLWKAHPDWETAEQVWDQGAKKAQAERPVKTLGKLPNMPGMTPETVKNLKWKSLWWMITKDKGGKVWKGILKHPLKYGVAFIKSCLQKKPFTRDGDFFLYGISSVVAFEKLLKNEDNIFILGFSYCEKPFECPSGRFTDQCIHDPENPVCRQCFIGKAVNALPERNTIPLFIPTIHYIGDKVLEIVDKNPSKEVLFVITACEMTLNMFGDWGNMAGIKGIGVRLDGRICNTMKAFELSENGIKPGLTVTLPETREKILKLLKSRREGVS